MAASLESVGFVISGWVALWFMQLPEDVRESGRRSLTEGVHVSMPSGRVRVTSGASLRQRPSAADITATGNPHPVVPVLLSPLGASAWNRYQEMGMREPRQWAAAMTTTHLGHSQPATDQVICFNFFFGGRDAIRISWCGWISVANLDNQHPQCAASARRGRRGSHRTLLCSRWAWNLNLYRQSEPAFALHFETRTTAERIRYRRVGREDVASCSGRQTWRSFGIQSASHNKQRVYHLSAPRGDGTPHESGRRRCAEGWCVGPMRGLRRPGHRS
jgi:hypothetical protein